MTSTKGFCPIKMPEVQKLQSRLKKVNQTRGCQLKHKQTKKITASLQFLDYVRKITKKWAQVSKQSPLTTKSEVERCRVGKFIKGSSPGGPIH